jgi:hypothetical protein
MTRRALWLPIAALALLAGNVADAQERGRARALFQEGRALMDDGQLGRACPLLAASARVEPLLLTRLALAACYERMGRTASAWAEYREAALLASRAGDKEWTREAYALERSQALEKRLVRLVIHAPRGVQGVIVRRNEQPVAPAELGVAVAVDPGPHVIAATAPGHEPWMITVKIGRDPVTTITVPPLRRSAPPADEPPPVS